MTGYLQKHEKNIVPHFITTESVLGNFHCTPFHKTCQATKYASQAQNFTKGQVHLLFTITHIIVTPCNFKLTRKVGFFKLYHFGYVPFKNQNKP